MTTGLPTLPAPGTPVGPLGFVQRASAPGTANFTQMAIEVWSLYSISASARAVSNGMDQYTGFLLR